MESNWTFLKLISVLADLITLAGVITAIRFALLKKDENVLAFRISLFIHYILRMAIIIIFLTLLYGLIYAFYFFFILILKGNVSAEHPLNWENGKEFQHILAYFVSSSIGLSVAWMLCSFLWTSSWNLTKEFINLFLPKNKIMTKQALLLEITNAVYGSSLKQIDVTQTLRRMVANNTLTIKASNDIAGDPDYGVAKALTINYRIGQKVKEIVINEGETQTLGGE